MTQRQVGGWSVNSNEGGSPDVQVKWQTSGGAPLSVTGYEALLAAVGRCLAGEDTYEAARGFADGWPYVELHPHRGTIITVSGPALDQFMAELEEILSTPEHQHPTAPSLGSTVLVPAGDPYAMPGTPQYAKLHEGPNPQAWTPQGSL